MRGATYAALIAIAASVTGCSHDGNAPAPEKQAAPVTETAVALPADVPVPIGLVGRKESAQPGTKFVLLQGRLPVTVPDATSAIRKQVTQNGWSAVGEPAPNDTAATLTFEKEGRTLSVTLVKVQNTETSVNILTGP